MSAKRAIKEVLEELDGNVRFTLKHHSGWIRCRVTAEALQHLTGGRYRSVEAFGAVRGQLQRTALAKYDAGHLDHDGGVTVQFSAIAIANHSNSR